jgi:general secretion pathway protein E
MIKKTIIVGGDVISIGKTNLVLVNSQPRTPRQTAKPAAPSRVEIDELEEIVDEDENKIDQNADAKGEADFERTIREMADSLPDRSFTEDDITLVNARGAVAHAARKPGSQKGSGEIVDAFRLLNLACYRLKATDIHVEPKAEGYQVRIRVDGTMVDVVRLSKEVGVKLCALVKILADIDIAQRNIVQEGHFSSRVPGRQVNYRVSFTPSMFGQKLVVRILDTATTPMHVWDLGLPEALSKEIESAIKSEAGMLLACGPTGSGKTTTLYAAVRSIDSNQRNVVTIEDPVEIPIEGITQIPVNEAQGNTFPILLRSILRQDPDAIMVGEIRDPETARIAMQAAITGHLVFSTIHSRDSIGTIFRLMDLGVEPYMVAQGLHMVIAQRLVRNLCTFCKKPVRITPEQLKRLGEEHRNVRQIYVPAGCPRCLNTGYAGRRAVHELLVITPLVREVIQKNPSPADIRTALSERNFTTLVQAGNKLVAEGITGFEEIERAVGG